MSMAKKGTGKRNSATGSLRRADADVNREKEIAKARAKVEKRRRQLGDATSALAALEATPGAARPPAVKTVAASAKAAAANPVATKSAAAARTPATTGRFVAAAKPAATAKAGASKPSSRGGARTTRSKP
jgi:hypothetical protein